MANSVFVCIPFQYFQAYSRGLIFFLYKLVVDGSEQDNEFPYLSCDLAGIFAGLPVYHFEQHKGDKHARHLRLQKEE